MGRSDAGRKAAATNKRKYGDDHYKRAGALATEAWKENGRKPRGFSTLSPERRREISLKGAHTPKKKRKTNGAS